MENFEQRCRDLVAQQLGVSDADIKSETKFMEDLGADSLDRVELVMALEDEFGLVIADEDGEKFLTFQSVVDYVKNAKAGTVVTL